MAYMIRVPRDPRQAGQEEEGDQQQQLEFLRRSSSSLDPAGPEAGPMFGIWFAI